jgi:hypothetical protein
MAVTYRSHVAKFKSSLRNQARERIERGSKVLHDHLVLSLSNAGGRSGRQYKVPGTNRTYTASAPGEYPALATGKLHEAIREGGFKITHHGFYFRATMGGNVPEYARYLEAGLRPWFARAVKEKWREVTVELRRKWF